MTLSLSEVLEQIGQRAAAASRILAQATTAEKNEALLAIAHRIEQETSAILTANEADLQAGSKNGLSPAMLDRARLDPKRIRTIANSVREVIHLTDPIGESLKEWSRPNGLKISKRRVPIGVIGIIYESRPNVTSDAATLCLKAGNAVILRGGSEAIRSNMAVTLMAQLDRYIHLIIPRGGRSLIEAVTSAARMPVIKHFDGICAIYVDRAADLGMAEQIVVNAKCQRPGVCNAIETMLENEEVARQFLPNCAAALWEQGVELRGDRLTQEILGSKVVSATETDWRTEYLDLFLAIKTVRTLEEAVEHIENYGSHHSDAIVTEDRIVAQKFLNQVDSATVFWNASTRFNDGGEFGFGAEIGISTDRLHARGPMGLEELTSYKYLVEGNGQIRG